MQQAHIHKGVIGLHGEGGSLVSSLYFHSNFHGSRNGFIGTGYEARGRGHLCICTSKQVYRFTTAKLPEWRLLLGYSLMSHQNETFLNPGTGAFQVIFTATVSARALE